MTNTGDRSGWRFRLLPPDCPVGWLPYTWLVYLSLFVVYAAFSRPSPLLLTAYIAGLLAFLALYFRGFWVADGPAKLPIMGGIVAIGAALIPFNPGASVFFVYAAGFAGDVGRPAVAIRCLLGIILVLATETLLVGLHPEAWVPGVFVSLIVGAGNIYFSERTRAARRLQLAQEEVEQLAKVAERERIARDLHDLLGHTLSLIVLKSELAAKLGERDPSRAVAEIRDVERISRDALAEVRSAVQGYRALTLAESIASARQALGAAGIELDAELVPIDADPRVEAVVALVVREAVTNIVRHAKATRCRLRLAVENGTLMLQVADDGVGGRKGADGTGLASMRARVEELQGTFEHDSDRGTTVRVTLPAGPVSATPAPARVAGAGPS